MQKLLTNPYVSFIYYINCWIVVAIMSNNLPLSLLQLLQRHWDQQRYCNLSLPEPGLTYLNDSHFLITYPIMVKLDKANGCHCMIHTFFGKTSLSKIILLSTGKSLNICMTLFPDVSELPAAPQQCSVMQRLLHNTRGSYDN